MLAALKSRGILVLFLVIIFYIAFSIYSNVTQLAKNLLNLDYYFIIPILILFTVSIFIKSIRQSLLLSHIGIKIPFKENFLIYAGGLSMIITPGGIGELIKSHFLKRDYGEPLSKTSPIVLIERYHDLLAVFSIVFLFFMINKISILIIPIFIIGVILLACILIIRKRSVFQTIQSKLIKIKFLQIFEKNSQEFNDTLFTLCSNRIILKAWVVGVAAWLFDAAGVFLCFQSLGQNFSFISITMLSFSSVLFGALSFLPAGIGVTEISFVKLLSLNGLSLSMAATLILLWRLLGDFYATSIGMIAAKILLSKKNLTTFKQ